jgi:hypothetical protein
MNLALGLLLLGLGVDGGAPRCLPFEAVDRAALQPLEWKWVSTEGDHVVDLTVPQAGCLYVTLHRWPHAQRACHSHGTGWVKAGADGLQVGMEPPPPEPEAAGLCRAMPSQTGEATWTVPAGVTRLRTAGDLHANFLWLQAH